MKGKSETKQRLRFSPVTAETHYEKKMVRERISFLFFVRLLRGSKILVKKKVTKKERTKKNKLMRFSDSDGNLKKKRYRSSVLVLCCTIISCFC